MPPDELDDELFFGEDHKSSGSVDSDKGPKINEKVEKKSFKDRSFSLNLEGGSPDKE